LENKSKNLQIGFILHFVFKKCIFALPELAAYTIFKRGGGVSKSQVRKE
jgi:hypothetical protein